MTHFLIQVLVFFLSTLSSALLVYISKTFSFYQQLIPVLLVLAILIATRINSKDGPFITLKKMLVLFITSLLIQIIVISSGGFYSPLFILLHIYTLGAVFLLGSNSPNVFLIFSLGVLVFHISFDRNLFQFFQNDPWAVIIYALSVIIVIPLTLYLSRSNRIKDQFSNFLREYIDMSEKKQKSILTALSNMVIVTDKNLNIYSINIAVERLLRTSLNQVEGHPLSEILILKDSAGVKVPLASLPIQEAIVDKATHFVEGYFLETKIQILPKPFTLQIRPLTNPSGGVTQIVFVLTDPTTKIGFNTHQSIREALKKRDQLLGLITSPSSPLSASSAAFAIAMITHIEEDILTVQEMEDHPLQEVIGFSDLVSLINQILLQRQYLYRTLRSIPVVSFDDDDKNEQAFLNLVKTAPENLNTSKYSAPIDSFLIKIVLEKLIDLSVFLTKDLPDKYPNVHLSIDQDGKIKIAVSFFNQSISEGNLPNLYVKDYPKIDKLRLMQTSGLEGYIADKIARTLEIPLLTSVNIYQKVITIEMRIEKQPKVFA